MNKKILLLALLPLLCSCQKTNELYKKDAYCHSEFDLNYYTEWNEVEKINVIQNTEYNVEFLTKDAISLEIVGYGEENKLSKIDKSFAYGYLSKLYDGRLSCGGLYQKSRVQINKTGYATFFPKQLYELSSPTKRKPTIEISLRGGTTCAKPLNQDDVKVNYHVSFFVRVPNSSNYSQIKYNLINVPTVTDKGGLSTLICFDATEDILNSVAMSMTFELVDQRFANLSDDMSNKEKEHFSIMLYEFMIPVSKWL